MTKLQCMRVLNRMRDKVYLLRNREILNSPRRQFLNEKAEILTHAKWTIWDEHHPMFRA